MRLSEAHADISVHLMTLNPGPGHGGMSCTSPSKSTFSMAWHHNRNAKNAQSPAEVPISGATSSLFIMYRSMILFAVASAPSSNIAYMLWHQQAQASCLHQWT